jgi:hypothetical protein
MALLSSSFPITFTAENLRKKIEELVYSNNWKEFEIKELKLVFKPFYVFNFNAFKEKNQGIVSDSIKGKKALNALTSELNEKIASFFKVSQPKDLDEEELPENFEVLQPELSLNEAKKVILVELSKNLSIPKENIFIFGLKLVLVPEWNALIKINEKNFSIAFSAIDGTPLLKPKIPLRNKGVLELSEELLIELREPKAWLKYFKNLLIEAIKLFSSLIKSIWKLSNYGWLTLLLLIILIIVLLNHFGIIKIF